MPTDRKRFARHQKLLADGRVAPGEIVNGLTQDEYLYAEMRLGMVVQSMTDDGSVIDVDQLIEIAQEERELACALPQFLSRLCEFTDQEIESVVDRLGPLGAEVVEFPKT